MGNTHDKIKFAPEEKEDLFIIKDELNDNIVVKGHTLNVSGHHKTTEEKLLVFKRSVSHELQNVKNNASEFKAHVSNVLDKIVEYNIEQIKESATMKEDIRIMKGDIRRILDILQSDLPAL